MRRGILVPIDGSDNALRALEHALAIARDGRPIHVINVEPPLDDYGMVPAYLTPAKHRRATRERAEAMLEPAIRRLKRARVPHQAHIVWGDVAPAVARAARRLGCEAIVMGTRGMGAAANLILGSTATKVVHLTKLPVTLVK